MQFERFSDGPVFTPLWHQLWAFVRDEGISLVGLDTAAVVFGGNENFRGQVTLFMRALVAAAVGMNGAIILNAHPSRAAQQLFRLHRLARLRPLRAVARPARDYDEESGEPRAARVLRGLGANYSAGLQSQRLEYRNGVFEVADDPGSSKRRKPLTLTERVDLRYRLLIGIKRVMQNGAEIVADEMNPRSAPNRARRSTDGEINRVALNDLYRAQEECIEAGQMVRVEVRPPLPAAAQRRALLPR